MFQASSLKDLVTLYYYGSEPVEQRDISTDGFRIDNYLDLQNIWTYGVLIIVILSMLSWVRNIAAFRFTFLFANILLLLSVFTVCGFSFAQMYSQGGFGDKL